MSISCTFNGVPDPSLSWLMDGNILTNGVDGVSIADTLNTSDLTVIDSGGEKGGSYICIANNTAGSSYNEFVIQCKYINAFLFSEMYTDCGKVYFGNCNFSAHTSFSVLTCFAQK